jgi:D-alanyl-D-alanine carboxypeptidase
MFLFIIFLVFNFSVCSFASIEISSPSAILIEPNTGKIIFEKNADERRYPASTTKIMTAIIVLENTNLSDIATVSRNAILTVPLGYSHAELKAEEEISIESLLNLLLVPSANDAANVLAEHVAGSVEAFSVLMNEKAISLGCKRN